MLKSVTLYAAETWMLT